MKKTTEIFTSRLPVGEKLTIKRTRFKPKEKKEKKLKRISIVSGIHGDELEGQLVIYSLAKWLNKNIDKLNAIVDIYPAVNPLGIDTITRSFPNYDIDLNRAFPGGEDEFLPGQVVHALTENIKGSDIAIDIHSSNIFLREIPQIRINKLFSKETLPLAEELNCDFIWIHDAVTVLEATFSHTLNSLGTKTLVVEMGVGMRLTKEYSKQLLTGILNLMQKQNMIVTDEKFEVRTPFSSQIGDVFYINAPKSGLFVPSLDHCEIIKKNEKIGEIVSPLSGEVLSELFAPNGGILFTLREYPVVYEGSLLARIFGEKSEKIEVLKIESLSREPLIIEGFLFKGKNKKAPKIAIVGPMEAQGILPLYCASKLVDFFKNKIDKKKIKGDILIIPSINHYAFNSSKRFWPLDNTNIDMMFPGYDLGETTQRIAKKVFDVLEGYDYGIILEKRDDPVNCIPYIKVFQNEFEDIKSAKKFGFKFIHHKKMKSIDTVGLQYNWQLWGTKAFSIMCPTTNRVNKRVSDRINQAILRFMNKNKIIDFSIFNAYDSTIIKDNEIGVIKSSKSGIFVAKVESGTYVSKNQSIGEIIDSLQGEVISEFLAPYDGMITCFYNNSLIYENAVAFRIAKIG